MSRPLLKITTSLWLFSLGVCPSQSRAEGAPSRSVEATSGENDSAEDEPLSVVVEGKPRHEAEPSRDSSVAGSVIRRQQLRKPGVQISDVLRGEPGVEVTELGGVGASATASLRGATAAQTPVYLGGIRLNDEVGGVADLGRVPVWFLDRVELYRSHAPIDADALGIGGAIYLDPRRALANEFVAGTLFGSYGTRSLWAYTGQRGDHGGVLAAARVEHSDNDYSFKDGRGTAWSQTTHVVLLDRFGTNVISWLNPETAQVNSQLPVGTGFESNPQDYLELDGSRAYLSRWGENAAAGQQDLDQGSDILVVDPSIPAVTGRISLPRDDELPPRPTRMTRIGDLVVVALQRRSLDYSTMGTAELVGIDTKDDSIAYTLVLDGLKDCSAPILSPDEKKAVAVCSGEMNSDGAIKDLGESAVVTLDISVTPPKEIKRYAASDLLGVPLQSDAAFASDSVFLLKTQSAFGSPENNQLFALDLSTSKTTPLLEASADPAKGSKGLVFGGLLCSAPCSTTCLLADKDKGVLQRIDVTTPNQPKLLEPVKVDEAVGLPPIGLGLF